LADGSTGQTYSRDEDLRRFVLKSSNLALCELDFLVQSGPILRHMSCQRRLRLSKRGRLTART
jgi:hypothetical protein